MADSPNGIQIRPDPGPVAAWPGSFVRTVHIDLDAARDGDGTAASPRNQWRGTDVAHAEITPGTRVLVRGTHIAGAYVELKRGGTAQQPVCYVFDDADWGRLTVESAVDLPSAPCASAAEGRGAENWRQLLHGRLPGTPTPDDFRLNGYWGAKRAAGRMSIFPSQDDADWLNYNNFLLFDNYVDVYWHPGIDERNPQFDPDRTRGRFRIGRTPGDTPARAAVRAALRAAVTPDQTPLLLLYVFPQIWRTIPCYRGDADGTPNMVGDYLLGAEGYPWGRTGMRPYPPDQTSTTNRLAICNLGAFVDRPGRFALGFSARDPWFVGWPAEAGAGFARSNGGSGIRILADHVWLHGGRFQGFGLSRGWQPGNPSCSPVYITAVNGPRVEHASFGPHYALQARDISTVRCVGPKKGMVLRRNSFDGNSMCRGISLGLCEDTVIEANLHRDSAGSAIAVVGPTGPRTYTLRLTVRDNLIYGKPDIHGNPISLYANHHALRATGNVVIGSSRPFVMQQGMDYDEATNGPAYAYIADNISICDGSWRNWGYGFRLTGRVKNAIVEKNVFGGNKGNSLSVSESNAQDAVIRDNILLGAGGLTWASAAKKLVDAGRGNRIYPIDAEPGRRMLQEAMRAVPKVPVGADD